MLSFSTGNMTQISLVNFLISILILIMMMIDKTNAVLDGVTSFLKYGTLDSSNSDVSTARVESVWWLLSSVKNSQRTVPGLCASKNGCHKGLSLGCLEAEKFNLLSASGFSCRGPYTTKITKKTGCRWISTFQQEVFGVLEAGYDHISVLFDLGLSLEYFALQENGQLNILSLEYFLEYFLIFLLNCRRMGSWSWMCSMSAWVPSARWEFQLV